MFRSLESISRVGSPGVHYGRAAAVQYFFPWPYTACHISMDAPSQTRPSLSLKTLKYNKRFQTAELVELLLGL